nr:SDR family NAD(P)-dependent oxidoreductase [Propionibacterium sp.]
MAQVLVTGSTEGLGLAAARSLLDDGHRVIVHARDAQRAGALREVADRAAGVVLGDLARADQTRSLAEQVNALGPLDAVIHNAGMYLDARRVATPEGHSRVLAVNVLAPYLLTCLLRRPRRLVYVTSAAHRDAEPNLEDADWTSRSWDGVRAYAESKLLLTTLAFAVARRWPDVLSNAVHPGWVPTRMGGPTAPHALHLGHVTQAWLAVSEDEAARTTGGYWFHQKLARPAPAALDESFQEQVLETLARLTGQPFTP